ncbi:MAG: DNA-directed RNA polymerase subunit beta', partial [Spirochaetia bacterium]|nr:DNA-directed RNA polymerase subunit beta' [Spirochaetia bacterium]
DLDEIMYAVDAGAVGLRAKISTIHNGKLFQTTPGRIIFNSVMPANYPYVNRPVSDKEINRIIAEAYEKCGSAATVAMLDRVKELGFHYATRFAPSIAISDVRVSPKKADIIQTANKEVTEVEKAHRNGVITNEERYKKVIEIWTRTNELITESMFAELEKDQRGFNPIFIMAQSGARGSKQQIRQLAGMRGLMARPSGEIIELAIRSNFREGLGVLEFFISTHGARKGLADTALKTADAGYLTRRLVDISQDVIITENDCGTVRGVRLKAVKEGEKVIVSLGDRVFGRVIGEPIFDPVTGKEAIPIGTMVGKEQSIKIDSLGVESLLIRSALTCETRQGICTTCYGMDLARLKTTELGEAVGIIAAQSIGQPGTQLTMRTFHVGGVATNIALKESAHTLPYDSIILSIGGKTVESPAKEKIFATRGSISTCRAGQVMEAKKMTSVRVEKGQTVMPGEIIAGGYDGSEQAITAETAGQVDIRDGKFMIVGETTTIPVKVGAVLMVKEGDLVAKNATIAKFDPFNDVVIAERSGTVELADVIEGKNLKKDEEGNFRIFE